MTPTGTYTKDQIQKLALSGIGLIVLLYVYFHFFLGPLNKGRTASATSIADVQSKLASSKSEMQKTIKLEQQAGTATARFAALKALSPEGAPIAWFPPRVKLFFTNHQIEKATVRLDSSAAYKEPEMAEWQRHTWSIELPQTDFATLGKAIAALENREPLLSISRISIKALVNDPQFQQVSLTAHSAIMKR